jgi:hypothetical protein
MKQSIILGVIILALGIIGCKNKGNDPKGVLKSFIDALGNKDINAAKKYATKDSEAMLGMIQMGMSMAPDSTKDKTYDGSNMDFGEATINGDKATVPVKDKKSGEIVNYTLKKENGDWKVAFDKATMTEMGKEKMKEHGNELNNNQVDSLQNMMQDLNKMNQATDDSLQ